MEQGKIFRERATAYFNSKTPCHIITVQDDWINGYIIEEPTEYYFVVLDKFDGKVKIHYIDIERFEEYIGDKEKLKEMEL